MNDVNEIGKESEFYVLLSLSKGAESRKRILRALLLKPKNCNQIADELDLDWFSVQKHLRILVEKKIITSFDFGHIRFYNLTRLGEKVFNDNMNTSEKQGRKIHSEAP
jgi:predicted transcriptional regulator